MNDQKLGSSLRTEFSISSLIRKLLTETIGTFFLVLTIGLTNLWELPLGPIAVGFILMAMVYMGMSTSGAHYNPAVSIVMTLHGKLKPSDLAPYLLAQILGAFLANFTILILVGSSFSVGPSPEANLLAILLSELLFTFALVLVIFHVAVDDSTKGNSYYGFAIGFTVAAGGFSVGPISDAVFNPAVAIATIVFDSIVTGRSLESLWIYIVTPIAAAIAASKVYAIQRPS